MTTFIPETASTIPAKILILGATGPTGRLSRGHDVTVLVRSAEKAKDLNGAELIVGDARNEQVLRQALKDRNAISALGTPASPFREVTILSTATRALVSAMKAESVSRLVAITGIGAGDSAGHTAVPFLTGWSSRCFCERSMPTRTARNGSFAGAASIGPSSGRRSSTTSRAENRSGH